MTDTPLTLGGRYELGDVLGRGGMAEVHIARDSRLGRQVAVKMLRPDLARDPSFQARFRREAQSAASLNHPAVVAVYDTGEDTVAAASVPYIVMEYVEGSTLRELLNSGRRLLPERAMEIVSGVLDALDYSHRHGIVHRDIKPANVMLTRTGDVKVMDFGIARALADTSATMTQTSAVIGTAQYLSPEQARGEQVDARSDLYSTGCLLYELLAGRPPFVGDSPVSVAYQHVREQPVPPSSHDPDVPPAADAITLKSLVKDREHRYQTAAEMRADIDRALAGRPVEAVAPSAAMTQQMPTVTAPVAPALAASTDVTSAEQPRRRSGSYALLALAVLAVFAGAAFVGASVFGDSPQVQVPAVEGLPEEQATATLLEAGLTVGDTTTEVSEQEPGLVLAQDPTANAAVDEGSAVDLVISTGPDTTTVPTLVALSLEDATEQLEARGLELGEINEEDSDQNEDQVLSTSPDVGETVQIGSTVDLVVASGSNTVPDVREEPEAQARTALEAAGFDVEVDTEETDELEPGLVLRQVPEPGESHPLDSTVTIVVSEAPPAPEPTEEPEPQPELEPEPEPTDEVVDPEPIEEPEPGNTDGAEEPQPGQPEETPGTGGSGGGTGGNGTGGGTGTGTNGG